MTRELSQISKKQGNYFFQITSLHPLNPDNKPDRFEEEALHGFEAGEKERYLEESVNGSSYFRYMSPLIVTEDCLQCHAKQGYKVGDVRGGISVSFAIEDFHKKLRVNTLLMAIFGFATAILTLSLVWVYTARLIRKVALARKQMQKMAITDELTKAWNRRHVIARFEEEFERSRRLRQELCCVMLDIDHFKHVNDTYGHQTGDGALKQVAASIAETLRAYDIVGRFGGEEFLIVLPETGRQNALALAERIRERVEKTFIVDAGSAEKFSVTASLGVADLQAHDDSIDDLIKRADANLYRAKEAGRNRVC